MSYCIPWNYVPFCFASNFNTETWTDSLGSQKQSSEPSSYVEDAQIYDDDHTLAASIRASSSRDVYENHFGPAQSPQYSQRSSRDNESDMW